MRRTILLLVAIALMLAVVGTPAAATPPTPAAGTITWDEFFFDPPRSAGPNIILTGSENSHWTGTFEGTAVDTFHVIAFPDGALRGVFWLTFTGTVGDAEGTLQMRLTLWAGPGATDEGGQWVIIGGGTGELASLHGQGSWTVTGSTDTEAFADYSGQIHSAP
jgi:hypothetical protein